MQTVLGQMRRLVMSRFLSVYWYALSFDDCHQFDCHRLSVRMGKNKRQNDKDEQDQKDLPVIRGV